MTGRIRQITDGPAISHPSYFLQSSFYPGGQSMFFTAYRSGSAQVWRTSLESGETGQLTHGAPIHPYSPALHPNGEDLIVTRGGSLWTGNRCIFEAKGAEFGECSISPDGEWLTAAYKRGNESGLVAGRFDGTNWQAIPFPRTVIHPQFHPLDPSWIEFAGDPAPRMHRVRRDGTGLECLYQHGNDEFIVHETFLRPTGDIVFTVWPYKLCRMDWTTRHISAITEYNAWHIAPDRRGERILCDTNHPDEGLQIIDVKTGARRQLCLSQSSNQGTQWLKSSYALASDFAEARERGGRAKREDNLSWMENAADTVYGPQYTHPHPSWSYEEDKVAFASDRTGVTQVYIVEVT